MLSAATQSANRRIRPLLVAAAASASVAVTAAAQGRTGAAPAKPLGHYADVNGIKLYYEIHGTGKPLVLLHGGLGAMEMFGPNLATLAKGRRVIAVDLQGHGRTADIDRPLSTALMADDIAALLKHLKIEKADFLGYSLGGGVALHAAIRHPEVVDRLILVSTPIRRNAFYADILVQQAQVNSSALEALKATPMYTMYTSLAPRPQDFGRLLDKIGAAMKEDFDLSADVARIKATTLIVAGDADIFPPTHAVEVFALLGGGLRDGGWDGAGRAKSRLAILPGVTHYSMGTEPAMARVALEFLKDTEKK